MARNVLLNTKNNELKDKESEKHFSPSVSVEQLCIIVRSLLNCMKKWDFQSRGFPIPETAPKPNLNIFVNVYLAKQMNPEAGKKKICK